MPNFDTSASIHDSFVLLSDMSLYIIVTRCFLFYLMPNFDTSASIHDSFVLLSDMSLECFGLQIVDILCF